MTTNSEHELAFANDSISSLFKRFAIPSVIGMLAIGVQSMIDGLIVGNLLGLDALAGISLVLPLYSFIGALPLIVGIGSQTLVGVGQGNNDYKKAQNSMTTGIISIIVACVIASAIILIWAKDIAYLLGANEVLESFSIDYIKGLFPFLVALGLTYYNSNMLRSMGHPRVSMVIMFLSVFINVVLNIFFIKVCEWGTFGVGLATGLAFILSAIISTYILQFKEPIIKLFNGKYKPRLLWEMFYNGSSEGVSELAAGITVFLFNVTLMKHLGESGVAAFTIINYIYFMGVLTLIGVSDGIIPIISYNFGAKQYQRIRSTFRMAVLVNISIGIIVAIILIFFSTFIVEAFLGSSEQDIIDIATIGAEIYAFAFLLNGFNILAASFFTAITDAKRSIIISALRGIIFMSIGIKVIPLIWGIKYVWYSAPISEMLTLIISIALLYKLFARWKKKIC